MTPITQRAATFAAYLTTEEPTAAQTAVVVKLIIEILAEVTGTIIKISQTEQATSEAVGKLITVLSPPGNVQ